MKKSDQTREKLLQAGQAAFWSKGYSNTSLREIAQDAGVDVALVARYFGGKRGLFSAALDAGVSWPELVADGADPVEVVIAKYANPATDDAEASAMQLVVANANDPEVGGEVRQILQERIFAPMQKRLGPDKTVNLALFVSAILGASMARRCLQLPGMVDATPDEYAAQLRHMTAAALGFPD